MEFHEWSGTSVALSSAILKDSLSFLQDWPSVNGVHLPLDK